MTRLIPLALALGCNNFTTISEACPEVVPGADAIDDPQDRSVALRLSCVRRLAKANRVRIDEDMQVSSQGHRDYLELNAPGLNMFRQIGGNPGFTGATVMERLENAGYSVQPSESIYELYTFATGDDVFDIDPLDFHRLFFDDPYTRGALLQRDLAGMSVSTARFEVLADEDSVVDDEQYFLTMYTMALRIPQPVFAEEPVIYPRNGQVDAPASYVHVTNSGTGVFEYGRTYGYPITFTVGARETGLVVNQAILTGPDGGVPFKVYAGAEAADLTGRANTVIMVPDQPLSAGQTYTANVIIESNQGSRTARTRFTTVNPDRPLVGRFARTRPGVEAPAIRFGAGARVHLPD